MTVASYFFFSAAFFFCSRFHAILSAIDSPPGITSTGSAGSAASPWTNKPAQIGKKNKIRKHSMNKKQALARQQTGRKRRKDERKEDHEEIEMQSAEQLR